MSLRLFFDQPFASDADSEWHQGLMIKRHGCRNADRANQGHFVAVREEWASHALVPDLVRQFALLNLSVATAFEELGNIGQSENGLDVQYSGGVPTRVYQFTTHTTALSLLRNRQAFQLSQVFPEDVEGRTPDDLTVVVDSHIKFADRFIKLTQRAPDHQLFVRKRFNQVANGRNITNTCRAYVQPRSLQTPESHRDNPMYCVSETTTIRSSSLRAPAVGFRLSACHFWGMCRNIPSYSKHASIQYQFAKSFQKVRQIFRKSPNHLTYSQIKNCLASPKRTVPDAIPPPFFSRIHVKVGILHIGPGIEPIAHSKKPCWKVESRTCLNFGPTP